MPERRGAAPKNPVCTYGGFRMRSFDSMLRIPLRMTGRGTTKRGACPGKNKFFKSKAGEGAYLPYTLYPIQTR